MLHTMYYKMTDALLSVLRQAKGRQQEPFQKYHG